MAGAADQSARPAADDVAGSAPPLPEGDCGPRNRYRITILADGRVVFGDLPGGLVEVAQVVAGSAVQAAQATPREGDDPP